MLGIYVFNICYPNITFFAKIKKYSIPLRYITSIYIKFMIGWRMLLEPAINIPVIVTLDFYLYLMAIYV